MQNVNCKFKWKILLCSKTLSKKICIYEALLRHKDFLQGLAEMESLRTGWAFWSRMFIKQQSLTLSECTKTSWSSSRCQKIPHLFPSQPLTVSYTSTPAHWRQWHQLQKVWGCPEAESPDAEERGVSAPSSPVSIFSRGLLGRGEGKNCYEEKVQQINPTGGKSQDTKERAK